MAERRCPRCGKPATSFDVEELEHCWACGLDFRDCDWSCPPMVPVALHKCRPFRSRKLVVAMVAPSATAVLATLTKRQIYETFPWLDQWKAWQSAGLCTAAILCPFYCVFLFARSCEADDQWWGAAILVLLLIFNCLVVAIASP